MVLEYLDTNLHHASTKQQPSTPDIKRAKKVTLEGLVVLSLNNLLMIPILLVIEIVDFSDLNHVLKTNAQGEMEGEDAKNLQGFWARKTRSRIRAQRNCETEMGASELACCSCMVNYA